MITRSKANANKRLANDHNNGVDGNGIGDLESIPNNSNNNKRFCTNSLQSSSSSSSLSSSSAKNTVSIIATQSSQNDSKTHSSSELKKRNDNKKTQNLSLISKSRKAQNLIYGFDSLLKPINIEFWQTLPPEILVIIFQHLLKLESSNRCQTLLKLAQVCDYWRLVIISAPLLWQQLDFSGISLDESFPMSTFEQLQRHNRLFGLVRELNFSGKDCTNLESIFEIICKKSNISLEHLNVSHCCNIYDNKFAKFPKVLKKYCRNLTSLDVSSITCSSKKIADRWLISSRAFGNIWKNDKIFNFFRAPTFRPILEKCGSNLKSLKMSHNMIPSFHCCLRLIGKYCQNLEMIDISNTMTTSGNVTWISVNQLQFGCPKLRILRAVNCNLDSDSTLLPGFPELEQLIISYSSDYLLIDPFNSIRTHSDQIIISLTKSSPKLSLLNIENTHRVTTRSLLQIPSDCVRALFIGHCTNLEDDSLALVIDKWNKSLVEVDLSENNSRSSIEACVAILCQTKQSRLESIKLKCSAATYETVKQLIVNCSRLSSIDITGCFGFPRGIRKTVYTGEIFAKFRHDILAGKYCKKINTDLNNNNDNATIVATNDQYCQTDATSSNRTNTAAITRSYNLRNGRRSKLNSKV